MFYNITVDFLATDEVKISTSNKRYSIWILFQFAPLYFPNIRTFPTIMTYSFQQQQLTTRIHLVLMVRMRGAIPPHSIHLYGVMLS